MKIIGVIGQNGSGKDEVLKYLQAEYGIPFLSTSDIVREIAAKEGTEPSRKNLGEISARYFREQGRGCFVRMAADRIRQNGWQVAGISGIRSLDDVIALREIFGKDFILVQVFVTDPHLRYARMSQRGEDRDPHSYEQFLKQDEAEEELFHITEAAGYARYSLNNDGTLHDLRREIEKGMHRIVHWLSRVKPSLYASEDN
jgi:dephospho-CoA kinase